MNIATIGLGIAKQFFQVHGVDENSRVVLTCPWLRAREHTTSLFLSGLRTCPEVRASPDGPSL